MKVRKVFFNALMLMMWAVVTYATFTALFENNDMVTAMLILIVLYMVCVILSVILTPDSYDKTIIKEHTKEIVTDAEKMKATIHLCVHHKKDDKCEVKVLRKTESMADPSMVTHEIELDFKDFLSNSTINNPRINWQHDKV